MFGFITAATAYAAPLFMILSPIISYTDQALSMRRVKSSAGFSLDIPLIMLVASICRVFYYPGARFDTALLVQSFTNIITQLILLKIALDYRPAPSSKGGEAALPFAGSSDRPWGIQRPYNFWRWKSPKPYWQFLLYLFITLTVLELIFEPFRSIYPSYSALVGYTGLTVEATLALPQLFANAQSRSCKGFRVSILASWLLGDALKMFWFFTSPTAIPLAFKLCGIFQAMSDVGLGVQFLVYGDGESHHRNPYNQFKPHLSTKANGARTPTGRGSPFGGEKRY